MTAELKKLDNWLIMKQKIIKPLRDQSQEAFF